MPKPEHMSQACWDKCVELQGTAPDQWAPLGINSGNIASGTYVAEDGSLELNNILGRVCNGFMQVDATFNRCQAWFITMDYQKGGVDKASAEAFIKWMYEESPFKEFILNDNIDTLYKGGCIVDIKKAGQAATLAISKLFRTFVEDTWRPKVWFDLVQGGVHPMIALVVSQNVDRNMKGTTGYRNRSTTAYHTHNSAIGVPTTKVGMAALFQPLKRSTSWTCHEVFGRGLFSSYGAESPFISLDGPAIKKVRKPDGWGGYVETTEKGDMKDYIQALKDLEKEYRK